jgi:prepilin-type N-terminal cleavage/methylation domain-containing protein
MYIQNLQTGGATNMPHMQIKGTSQKGFTLVELLLVIALLAISVGITGDIMLSLVRSFSKTQVLTEIEQQSNFVSLKLEKELKGASTIIRPTAGLGSDVLTFESASNTVSYGVVDNIIYRASGDYDTSGDVRTNGSPLTSDESPGGVHVTCASGECFLRENASDTERPQVLTLQMIFDQAQSTGIGSFTGQVNLNKTVVLRRSY